MTDRDFNLLDELEQIESRAKSDLAAVDRIKSESPRVSRSLRAIRTGALSILERIEEIRTREKRQIVNDL